MLEFLLRYRILIWTCFLALLVVSIFGASRLSVTPDNRVFYGAEDPYFAELIAFETEFRSNTSIAFVLTCENPIFSCSAMAPAIRKLTALLGELESVTHVDSLATYPYIISTNEMIATEPYLDHVCPRRCEPSLANDLRQKHLIGRFISQDLRTTAIIASIDLDINDEEAVQKIFGQATKMLEDFDDDLEIRFVGTVPLMKAFVDATNQELTGTMGLAIVCLIVTLYITLNSVRMTSIIIALGLTTIVITLGVAGWFGLVLNTATATIPLILFTLTVATSMHLFMYVVRMVTEDVRTNIAQAVSASLETQNRPILMTAATTIVCMLSLGAVSSPPVQDIGLWTAVGAAIGTLLLLLVVPLSLVNIRELPRSKWQDLLQPILNRYARTIEQNRISSSILLVILAISMVSIFSLDIDDDFVRYFDEDNSFRIDSEFVAEKLIGPNNVEVVVDSGVTDGIFDQQYISFLGFLVENIRKNPDVKNATSLLDILKPISVNFADVDDLRLLDPEQIAQIFLGYELSLSYGQSTSDIVNMDRSRSRISILLDDVSASRIRAFEKFVYTLSAGNSSDYQVRVTGESIPISHLSPRNITAMVLSILSTFLLTSIAIGVYFQQWRISVIALVSTVVPVLCGFGIWGLFSDTIGLSVTVIVAVCMGVVIDDSIHMIYRHRYALDRLHLGNREAAAFSIHRVGTAILTTTVVLVVGFSVLLFSDFRLNSTFGGCSALIMVSALVFDLRILPEMLVWATRSSR